MTYTQIRCSKWQCAALVLLLGSIVQAAFIAVVNVPTQDNLNDVLTRAQVGDMLRLVSGTYKTKLYINKPITTEGPADRSAKIVGDRSGRMVAVHAPDVTLRDLTVPHFGMNLPAMDAGIYLEEAAVRALVEHNNIIDNSAGVYIHGAVESIMRENKIIDDTTLRVSERGNGVTVRNAPGAQVVDNDTSKGRDGIFSSTSTHNTYKGNRFSDLRFAVHYMYISDSEVSNGISVGSNMGYALMFSERLKVYGDIAVGNHDQGIMLNHVNHSEIHDNVVNKAGKCVFVCNANYDKILANHFENCQIGIHLTVVIEGTTLYENSSINNESQVKYASTRFLDWGEGGRGNHWSDNSAFDLDGDSFGNSVYRPNGIIDQIIWCAPVARLLMNSPATNIVRWAQSQFPAILPGGVTNNKPLVNPVRNKTTTKYKAMRDELLHGARTYQSEQGNTGNGALTGGNANM